MKEKLKAFGEKIKKNWCKIIMMTIQVAFLGGGPVYISQLNDFKNEIVKQVDRANEIVGRVEKTGKNVNNTINNINKQLESVKKVCKKVGF